MDTTHKGRHRRWAAGRIYAKKGLGAAISATIASLIKLGWEYVRREHGL
ncbi:hypothetical protein [Streptomyces sp. NPDC005322]